MNIIYVINQHRCDKIKDYLHADYQIKIYFYFQYIKTCLWLLLVFLCKDKKSLNFSMFEPIHIMLCNVCFNRNNTSLEVDCKDHNQGYDERF
jgi:hypothetical protein